jgi:hypothetical protein
LNAQQLLFIALRANQLQKEDFNDLLKYQQAFPYFQLPAILLAKYEYAHSHGENNFLATAAIGSPDRAWLKNLIENPRSWEQFSHYFADSITHPSTAKKNTFERKLIDDLELTHPLTSPSASIETNDTNTSEEELQNAENEPNSSHIAAASTASTEAESERQLQAANLSQEEETEPTSRIRKKRKVQDEDLIETIRKREKKEIKDDKKKEQLDIIKEFNKKGIKLATIREIESNYKQADLSEKSTQINDSLITESLARLFVKQNKKTKAKEIYQKLIVKFPEKSTYFADQIKNLEEN